MPPIVLLIAAAAAVFGLAIGSFLDVVASRLPRGGSLLHPASHCPACQAVLRWRENVPVLSWLALRGRCRTCGATIAVRVVLIEALTAAAFGAVALVVGRSWSIPGLCLLVATALAVAAAAADDAALPPGGVLVGTATGAAALVAAAAGDGDWGRLVGAALGAASGGVAILAVLAAARNWPRRREQIDDYPPATTQLPAASTEQPLATADPTPPTAAALQHPSLDAVDTIEMLLPVGTLIGWLGATAALGALAGAALVVTAAMVASGAAIVAGRHRNRPAHEPAVSSRRSTSRGFFGTRRTRRLVIAIAGIVAMAGSLSTTAVSSTIPAGARSSMTRSGLLGTATDLPWPSPR